MHVHELLMCGLYKANNSKSVLTFERSGLKKICELKILSIKLVDIVIHTHPIYYNSSAHAPRVNNGCLYTIILLTVLHMHASLAAVIKILYTNLTVVCVCVHESGRSI